MPNFNNKAGSGFVNLQRYLGANQNNRLGQNISSGINTGVSAVRNDVSNAQTKFLQDAEKNKIGNEQDKAQESTIINKAQNLGGGQVLDEKDVNDYGRLSGGSYKGPERIDNIGELKNRGQEASQYANAVGSTGGRFGLLQRFIGGQNYNQGQQRLDSMLIGNGNDLRAARRNAVGLNASVGQADAQTQAVGQAAAADTDNFTKSVRERLMGADPNQPGGILGAKRAELTGAVENANLLRGQAIEAARTAARNRQATGVLAGLKNQTTWGIDPNEDRFWSEGQKASLENLTSNENLARYGALAKLAGQDQTFVGPLSDNKYNKDQAVGFDVAGFRNAAAGREQEALAQSSTLDEAFNTAGQGYNSGQARKKELTDSIEMLRQHYGDGTPRFLNAKASLDKQIAELQPHIDARMNEFKALQNKRAAILASYGANTKFQ